jgi:hypothetical protein
MLRTQERSKSFREWIQLISQEKTQTIAGLLDSGNWKESFRKGITPLHLTAHIGSLTIFKILIEKGLDINARTDYGYTPLHYASREGNYQLVSELLKAGADPYLTVTKGDFIHWRPVDFAFKQKQEEVLIQFAELGIQTQFPREIKSAYEDRFFCEECLEPMLVLEEEIFLGAAYTSEPTELTFHCENCGFLQSRLV